jgi:hypothetical protein
LFDIFIEDLVDKLAKELKLNIEDILLYADDLLVLCQTENQVKACIKIIEEWSAQNGMELNKKKSGVLIFASRRAKKIPYMKIELKKNKKGKIVSREWVVSEESYIQGIPIVAKYKYLGTFLDPKLTMRMQNKSIETKSNFLFVRLYPYLVNATAEGRKDMWRSMVLPLFNTILVLIYFEKSKTNCWGTLRLLIGTFKKFMMIPNNTCTKLVAEMIGTDVEELVRTNALDSEEKWEARKERRKAELAERTERKNYLKGIPNDWCEILKLQCKVCLICKKGIRNEEHMETYHNIDVFDYKEIWASIKRYYDWAEEAQRKKKTILKAKRVQYLEYWKHRLKGLREDTENKFRLCYIKTS